MRTSLIRGALKTAAAAAVALTTLTAVPAQAAPIGLELLLLVDVSGSVDAGEYNLQKTGYVNAFKDVDIQNAIAAVSGGVAVAYAEWSSAAQQSLLVSWTLLTDAASVEAFADAINASSRAFSGLTAPGSAINWGTGLFTADNGFEGARLVMDVSGDGPWNDGADTFNAATAARAAGITINGLPILTDVADLDDWYQDNIVTPGGGFLQVASDFDSFEGAVKAKIGREITNVPEPGAFALVGLALVGLAARRRVANR